MDILYLPFTRRYGVTVVLTEDRSSPRLRISPGSSEHGRGSNQLAIRTHAQLAGSFYRSITRLGRRYLADPKLAALHEAQRATA